MSANQTWNCDDEISKKKEKEWSGKSKRQRNGWEMKVHYTSTYMSVD